MSQPFKLKRRLQSFRHAFSGLWILLKTQHNAWIHLLATLLVVVLGLFLQISRFEWCWLILAVVGVWVAEALNTALEFLAAAVHPEHHPMVGKSKDAAAGAVLISAVGACIIGLLILGPHILNLFQ
jgi:diacylglycerol kinase (ATP)